MLPGCSLSGCHMAKNQPYQNYMPGIQAMKVTTEAVQGFGRIYGYTKDYPVESFVRDAKITQI